VIAAASCQVPLPAGAPTAAALPVYAGTCPVLASPPAVTTIASSGAQRTFLVYRPTTIAPGEKLPVVFLWHWLGGSPDGMASKLEVQAAVDARRFIGVIPAPKGDATFRWPFEVSQSQGRVDEEARFFDDMLACVGAALPANKECVSSMGVSAGALWTAQLATLRSERLASMVSLSGGVDGVVRGWSTTPHRLPALVLWGGANDMYPSSLPIMNFQNASKSLIGDLAKDGHFILECTHNCGHAVPPFDAPAAGSGGLLFDPVWRFVLDHPYWLAASKSPYAGKPLPAAYPAWCGQGAGSAIARPNGAACQ
jgi:predicted esterase